MKRHDKKIRKEKQDAFNENKFPKTVKSKICKVTKGEHIYNVAYKTDWRGYSLKCECGKQTWKINQLYPLRELPKYFICEKHGYYEIGRYGRKDEGCWACKLKLKPFKDNLYE